MNLYHAAERIKNLQAREIRSTMQSKMRSPQQFEDYVKFFMGPIGYLIEWEPTDVVSAACSEQRTILVAGMTFNNARRLALEIRGRAIEMVSRDSVYGDTYRLDIGYSRLYFAYLDCELERLRGLHFDAVA